MKWIDIENIIIDESVNSIHVDTRDFHAIVSPEKRKRSKKRKEQRREKNDLYLIKDKDIKGWLKYLKDITGGEGKWRYMSFSSVNYGGWVNYLRLYRINEDSFIVCNSYDEPLEWRLMRENNLRKEYLCCKN